MAEIWFRNPVNYVRELIECNEANLIFDYGFMVKRNIKEPKKWADLYYSMSGKKFRLIACGAQGAAEYRPESNDPVAVYPVFEYGENEAILEEYMSRNVGDGPAAGDKRLPIESRPVAGQEHRVVVMNYPDLNTGPGKKFLQFCRDLQEDYPDCILMIHGSNTFSLPIRMGFKAFDWDARTPSAKGKIFLPTGRQVQTKTESLQPAHDWIRFMGFKPVELQEPRVRCIFNVKSASWAASHYVKDLRIAPRNTKAIDTTVPDAEYDPEENNAFGFRKIAAKPGDKFICDECSLAFNCKFYREGSVCGVPKSEPRELTKYFKTRDSGSIMDGLAKILEINSERVLAGLDNEADFGLDPEVTRILGQMSKDGAQLAKLVDPSLRSPKVAINVGSGNTTNNIVASPKQFIAAAIRELEQQGFERKDITSSMIEGLLQRAGAERDETTSPYDNGRVLDAPNAISDGPLA